MGEFRFLVPMDWDLDPYHGAAIHVVGMDGVPWPCRIEVTDEPGGCPSRKLISVSRNNEESGRTYVIYPFEERGELLICTGTLPVREQPYELLTELARGTLNRLRNQISIWAEGGLDQIDRFDDQIAAATRKLAESIHGYDSQKGTESARQSLAISMSTIFELTDTFGEQVSRFRRSQDTLGQFWLANSMVNPPPRLGSVVDDLFDFSEVCLFQNGSGQPPDLAKAWAEDLGKRIILGPWIDASQGGMRQDLADEKDFQHRKNRLLFECRQQLEFLPSSTSLLHVVSGLNGIGHRHLSYPQQLQITIDLLRLVEDALVEVPTMVSFDFPWGERLAGAVGGVHPIQIADSLLRQGLQISLLGIDVNLDYWPNGSVMRDPLQWIDLLDTWSQLGLPLVLCLRAPSGGGDTIENVPEGVRANQTRSNVTDSQRVEFLTTILPMMVARPAVQGMIWRQWTDADDFRFPGGGLVDAKGNAKPMFAAIEKMKTAIRG